MKPKAYVLVFDGMADWEPAHVLCEINKSQKYEVVATGFSDKQVTTMGGLKLVSEITIRDVKPAEAGIFIMPGGDLWESYSDGGLIDLLNELRVKNVPIGAICGATLEIARAGLTSNVRHTSNGKEYLKTMVPDYQDEEFYVDALAISDNDLITASGLGSVEFGREIIKQLHLYDEDDTKLWFDMFKHGLLP